MILTPDENEPTMTIEVAPGEWLYYGRLCTADLEIQKIAALNDGFETNIVLYSFNQEGES